jgi:hypothetical protein
MEANEEWEQHREGARLGNSEHGSGRLAHNATGAPFLPFSLAPLPPLTPLQASPHLQLRYLTPQFPTTFGCSTIMALESNVHQSKSSLHRQVTLIEAQKALGTYAEQKQNPDGLNDRVCGKSFYGPQELEEIFVQCRVETPKYCLSIPRRHKSVKINGSGEDSDNRLKGGPDFKKSKPSQRTTEGLTKRTSKHRPREKRNDISMAHRRPSLRRET